MRLADPQEINEYNTPGGTFKLMSYNLLADKLLPMRATHLQADNPTK